MAQHAAHAEPAPHGPTVGIYITIFLALMVFTALTVFAAYFDLAHIWGPLNAIVAMTIAVTKATLVVLFFMHVKYSSRLTQVIVAAGVFWLLILFAFIMGDYLSRTGWPTPLGQQ